MSCNDPNCTCCQRAYLEGLNDGFRLGYKRGYKAGHANGYVNGYVDAALHLPPPSYQREIRLKIAAYLQPPTLDQEPINYLPKPYLPKRRACGCYGACTCGREWK